MIYLFDVGPQYQAGIVRRLNEWSKLELQWHSMLEPGETVIRSSWVVLSGSLTLGDSPRDPRIIGGVTSCWATGVFGVVTNTVTTTLGNVYTRAIAINTSAFTAETVSDVLAAAAADAQARVDAAIVVPVSVNLSEWGSLPDSSEWGDVA